MLAKKFYTLYICSVPGSSSKANNGHNSRLFDTARSASSWVAEAMSGEGGGGRDHHHHGHGGGRGRGGDRKRRGGPGGGGENSYLSLDLYIQ